MNLVIFSNFYDYFFFFSSEEVTPFASVKNDTSSCIAVGSSMKFQKLLCIIWNLATVWAVMSGGIYDSVLLLWCSLSLHHQALSCLLQIVWLHFWWWGSVRASCSPNRLGFQPWRKQGCCYWHFNSCTFHITMTSTTKQTHRHPVRKQSQDISHKHRHQSAEKN